MSSIISALISLVDPSKSALIQDVEGAFGDIEGLISDIKSRNMSLAMTHLEQAAYYILKGLVEYNALTAK